MLGSCLLATGILLGSANASFFLDKFDKINVVAEFVDVNNSHEMFGPLWDIVQEEIFYQVSYGTREIDAFLQTKTLH